MIVLRNSEESESDKAIEYSEELDCFYVPPSPTYFPPSPTTFPWSPPLYFPLSSPPRPSSSNSSDKNKWNAMYMRLRPRYRHLEDNAYCYWQDVELGLFVEYEIQDRGGVLDVIPGGKLMKINGLEKQHDDIVGHASEELAILLEGRNDGMGRRREIKSKDSEPEHGDSVERVIESVEVQQYLIQYRGDAVGGIEGWGALTFKGLEVSDSGALSTTPEPPLIFQTKTSIRVWQGLRGEWGAEFRFEWNWLNIGTFKIEGAALTNEWVFRCRGGKDYIDSPFPELSLNKNREEPTRARITEIQALELPPTAQQDNLDEDFGLGCSEATGNDESEAVGIDSWNCCDSTTIQGFKVSQSTLNYACREYGMHIWPPPPNNTPMLVDQAEIPLLNSDTLPSDQALAATVDTNSVLVKVVPPPLVLPTAQQENLDEDLGNDEVEAAGIGGEGTEEDEIAEAQLHTGCFGKRKRKEKSPRERGNKKTTRVKNVIPLEEILQMKEMHLKDAARHLNVSQSALKRACREHGINRWPPHNKHEGITQSLPNETPAVVDQEGIPKLTSDTLPSDQALTAIVDPNNVVEETAPQQFSSTVRQENPDEDSSNDEVEAIGMGGVGIGEGEMQRNEKAPGGERGGVRIEIPLEEILKYKDMRIEDAATELKVSRSTLKRVCRGYCIKRWPPREKHELIGQSRPNKSPVVVDQERNPQLNSTTLLLSNEESASINTNSVTVKAKYEGDTFKFQLYKNPWRVAELKEQVKKRLQLKTRIKYKDEDGDLISIVCDDDLQQYILSSRSQGNTSIVVLLEQKNN